MATGGEPAGGVAAAVARDQKHGAAAGDLVGVEAAPALVGRERQEQAAAGRHPVEPGGGRMGGAGVDGDAVGRIEGPAEGVAVEHAHLRPQGAPRPQVAAGAGGRARRRPRRR